MKSKLIEMTLKSRQHRRPRNRASAKTGTAFVGSLRAPTTTRGSSLLVVFLIACLGRQVESTNATAATSREMPHLKLRGHSPLQKWSMLETDKQQPFDAFPLLSDVSEMANLSNAVYRYRKWTGVDDNNKVCDDWNKNQQQEQQSIQLRKKAQRSPPSMGDVTCHWYQHDVDLGTQVMIVSSHAKDYVAIVFAGTDDLKTSLLDVDVRKVRFGTEDIAAKESPQKKNVTKMPIALEECPDCRVHEGFNSAVFANGIFDEMYERVEALRPKFSRIFSTGHSLGAANSILAALAMAMQFEAKQIKLPNPIQVVNYGCPQVGNDLFQQHIHQRYLTHSAATKKNPYLSIWRFVLGWDLVPRLPEFFDHIGHTIQMHHPECTEILTYCDYNKWFHPYADNTTKEGLAYYHHVGNETLHYDGVPSGWSEKPYVWVPGALLSHAIQRYADFFADWITSSSRTWVQDFVPATNHSSPPDHNDALIDDDTYAEPPDDAAATAAKL